MLSRYLFLRCNLELWEVVDVWLLDVLGGRDFVLAAVLVYAGTVGLTGAAGRSNTFKSSIN